MQAATASSSAQKENNAQSTFQWLPEMIEYLIVHLKDYKTELDYKNVNFTSNVVALHSCLHEHIPAQRSDKDIDTTWVENG